MNKKIEIARVIWRKRMEELQRGLTDDEIHGVAYTVLDEDPSVRNITGSEVINLFRALLLQKRKENMWFYNSQRTCSREEIHKILHG